MREFPGRPSKGRERTLGIARTKNRDKKNSIKMTGQIQDCDASVSVHGACGRMAD